MRVVILGLSITSSWGNGHATNYRGLVRALAERGHDIVFLERDVPWYAENRDAPAPAGCRTELYGSTEELADRFSADVAEADVVLVGSYVPDGIRVARWATDRARLSAFWDIDTPVTLAALERGDCDYLDDRLVATFDLYLSFTGGPTLRRIERQWGSPGAAAFYCLVDHERYQPVDAETVYDLGYLGTYGADRQPALDRLQFEPARRRPELQAVVAGPQYPPDLQWPPNVARRDHVAPADHAAFYCSQRLTVNVTRADMVRAGWSPSVRLFEAAACAVPVISDVWPGIEDFFVPGDEILLGSSAADVLAALDLPHAELSAVGERARRRALAEHTAERRAEQFESLVDGARRGRSQREADSILA
jgi:spore maturation protein CgeB